MRLFFTSVGFVALPLLLSLAAQAQTPKFYGPDQSVAGANTVTLQDMNADGKPDCVIGTPWGGGVAVFHGDGAGGFARAATVAVGRGALIVRTADVNRDGKPDIVTLNVNDNTISVRLANGSGGYTGSDLSLPYYSAKDMYVADVTGDGIADYLVWHRGDGLVVYPGDGQGGYNFAGHGVLGTGFDNGAQNIYPADVNGDGKLDVLAQGFNEVQYRLGNGNGTFGDIHSIPVPATPVQDICVGDFNNDGRLDVLAIDGNNQLMYVRLQQAGGTFTDGQTIATVRSPYPVRIGDLNGDGKPDIVVGSDRARGVGPAVEIFFNTGTGTFAAGEETPVNGETADVAIGDVNLDGRLDFMTANYDDTYSVRLNSRLPQRFRLAASTPGGFQKTENKIQWKPGTASDRVVFIREVRPGRAPLAEPADGLAYLANQPEMNSATRIAPGTYTLGRAQAGDSLALLRNGSIGHVYEVGVFEYVVDPVNGPMYRRDKSVKYTFTASRYAPQLIGSQAGGKSDLEWKVAAQYKATQFQLQASTDGVTFSAAGQPVAAMDSAATAMSYSQSENSPTGQTLYRVMMTHADGTVLYSNVVPLGSKPLPVELVEFSGTVRGQDRAALSWATASEKNSAYFDVERSEDGSTFSKVGRVAGAGSSTQRRTYSYLDITPLIGSTYYRLRQVDLDGTTTFSRVVVLVPSQYGSSSLAVAPNPAANGEQVSARLAGVPKLTGPIKLIVRAVATGQVVKEQTLSAVEASDYRWSTAGYAAGVYLVEVVSKQGRWTSRLLVY